MLTSNHLGQVLTALYNHDKAVKSIVGALYLNSVFCPTFV